MRLAARLLAASWLCVGLPLMAPCAPALPHDRPDRFLGVDTCGSGECHGSTQAWRNATVLMKERLIWEQRDHHAKAYTALTGEKGERIARNLGLARAEEAPECLTCHTTYVPEAQRGPKFRLEAGVGCESCHGPGSAFLATHVQPTARHEASLEAGLYPTNLPTARAQLCLSCHAGDDTRQFSHRLYGAGHPRLRFELDTYTALQPYHYNLDADYRRRKPLASHVAVWAQGQLASAVHAMTERRGQGPLPELAGFDCQGCHRAIGEDKSYQPRAGQRLGAPLRDDTALFMVRALATLVAPETVPALADALPAWRSEWQDPAQAATARTTLTGALTTIDTALAAHPPTAQDGPTMIRSLLRQAQATDRLPYLTAEMLAMSLSTLLAAAEEDGLLTASLRTQIGPALDRLYQALGAEQHYRPQAYAEAIDGLAAVYGVN